MLGAQSGIAERVGLRAFAATPSDSPEERSIIIDSLLRSIGWSVRPLLDYKQLFGIACISGPVWYGMRRIRMTVWNRYTGVQSGIAERVGLRAFAATPSDSPLRIRLDRRYASRVFGSPMSPLLDGADR